jgi:release factor glutamine methyltransferase
MATRRKTAGRSQPLPGFPQTVADRVRAAARVLEDAGWSADKGRRDAEVLARSSLDWTPVEWVTRQREPASLAFCAHFDAAVARRQRHEPVAYITGVREFYGRPFEVTHDVLIPRPETELVIQDAGTAIAAIRRSGQAPIEVADVGTGSGCLAVTLALEHPDVRVTGTDVSARSLAVATRNAERLGAGDRVACVQTSLAGPEAERFDLVVSNPPYVAERDRLSLAPDVRDFEPALALFGGLDGLDVFRELLPAAGRALRPGGWLVVEIGCGQEDDVTGILGRVPELSLIGITPDLAGIPRVLTARKKAPGDSGAP